MSPFPKSVWTLIRELGLQEEFIPGDSRAKRYILQNGKLHRAPFSAGGLLTTSLVGLNSKYSLLSEVFRLSQPPAHEESLAPALCLQRWSILRHEVFVDPNSAALISVEVRPAGKCCFSQVPQFVAELVRSQEPYTAAVTRWPEN